MRKVKILVYENYIECFGGSSLGTRHYVEIYQKSFVTALGKLNLPQDEERYENDLKKVVENLEHMPPDYYTDPWGYTYPKTRQWSLRLYVVDGYKNELGELLLKSSDAQVD